MSYQIKPYKKNVESSLRLYCYLKRRLIPLGAEEAVIMYLLTAYDGLTFTELEKITGMKRFVLKSVLENLLQRKLVILDQNLIPGRAWLAEGTKGIYYVSEHILAASKKFGPSEISGNILRTFAIMLFNVKEHASIIGKYSQQAPKVGIFSVFNTALGAILKNANIFSLTATNDVWQDLDNMGYIKNFGECLNRQAYLLDKQGVMLK